MNRWNFMLGAGLGLAATLASASAQGAEARECVPPGPLRIFFYDMHETKR